MKQCKQIIRISHDNLKENNKLKNAIGTTSRSNQSSGFVREDVSSVKHLLCLEENIPRHHREGNEYKNLNLL